MYKPTFDGPIRGYVLNSLTKNGWRFAATMERQDVLQEAYLVFHRCATRYPETDTPQHFMALFKTAWARHMVDLAHEDTSRRTHEISFVTEHDDEQYDAVGAQVGDLDNNGYVNTLVRQAPSEVRMVLNLFLNAPSEILDMMVDAWRGHGGTSTKKGRNRMVCAALGLPEETDALGNVEAYLVN